MQCIGRWGCCCIDVLLIYNLINDCVHEWARRIVVVCLREWTRRSCPFPATPECECVFFSCSHWPFVAWVVIEKSATQQLVTGNKSLRFAPLKIPLNQLLEESSFGPFSGTVQGQWRLSNNLWVKRLPVCAGKAKNTHQENTQRYVLCALHMLPSFFLCTFLRFQQYHSVSEATNRFPSPQWRLD